jgi:ketosteroid isomerase-like protein
MSELDDIRAMATRFFDAIEAGDIATMRGSFTPDAEIWHNTDELIVTPDQTAATLTGMVARIKDREYAERRLTVFPGGFVQQHVLRGRRTHDDGEVRLPCAIICTVAGGKITRLDEYFDSAHVATFRKFANA